MPFTHNISEEEQLISVKASGAIDLRSCVDAITVIADTIEEGSTLGLLIDIRDSDFLPGTLELKSLAQILSKQKQTRKFRGKVIVVTTEERGTIISAMCTVAYVWGFPVKPFTDLEEAKKYLKSQQKTTGK